MTIRPVPFRTRADVMELRGCIREGHEVRCECCGKFMSEVVLVIHYDNDRIDGSGMGLGEYIRSVGLEVKIGAMGKCARCKEENAQILFSA